MKNVIQTITLTTSLLFAGSLSAHHNLMVCQIPLEAPTLLSQAKTLNPHVLSLALKAHDCAEQAGIPVKKEILTIIDYSLPSAKKRLWVINLKTKKVLNNLHVAHGKNTGNLVAKYFSDTPGSKESSLGLFITQKAYVGEDDYSLRLKGLEKGINDTASRRVVVIHGAWYVSPKFLKTHGRLGRSWGCPAINKKYVRKLINTIRGGSLVFAYYPKGRFLEKSKFLHCKLKLD